LDLYIKSFLIDIISFNHEKTPQITYLAWKIGTSKLY
jgi:hypothetical protein